MHRRLTLCALLSLQCLGPASAHAYCRLTTEMPVPGAGCSEEGVGLFWERQCISYSLLRRPEPEPPLEELRDAIDRSFQTWAEVSCDGAPLPVHVRQTIDLGACDQPEYNGAGPNANSIMFLDDWAERGLEERAFGLTLVWHDPHTGKIFDADMQINETLGELTICDQDRCAGQVDVQNVVTHEAGHFLGLGHSAAIGSAMSSRAAIGETQKRILSTDDVEGVCSIYTGYDQPSCLAADYTPDRGFTPECIDPPSSCAAAGGTPQAPGGYGALAFALVWLGGRRRVRTSSSRPRAISR